MEGGVGYAAGEAAMTTLAVLTAVEAAAGRHTRAVNTPRMWLSWLEQIGAMGRSLSLTLASQALARSKWSKWTQPLSCFPWRHQRKSLA
jgi:hypothetical protein